METGITRAEHAEFTRRMEAEHERQNRRLELLETGLQETREIAVQIERLAASIERMTKEQERQGKRLEVLEGRDGEKWRRATGYVVTTIISLALGYVFAQLGL